MEKKNEVKDISDSRRMGTESNECPAARLNMERCNYSGDYETNKCVFFLYVIIFFSKSQHSRARAHARRHYLAGYLLRSEPSAPTWFRCSRNPAVAEPPRSVSKPMLRLEERSLEKLLAMVESGRTGGGTGGPDTRIKSF